MPVTRDHHAASTMAAERSGKNRDRSAAVPAGTAHAISTASCRNATSEADEPQGAIRNSK
jgi:hypothetical protein